MLFPERLELEQDPNVHEAEEGNADTAPDGGLKKKQPDLSQTGSCVCHQRTSRRSRMDATTADTKGRSAPARTPSPRKWPQELPS